MSFISRMSLRRPISSYSKVQKLVGHLIRNRTFQLRRVSAQPQRLRYLDVGCGPSTHENFINLDYLWHPKIDVCWEITRGLPFPDVSMDGIFTEHCLEHFSLPVATEIMKECRRILRPGGILRIVVPDGELYLNLYNRRLQGDDTATFPFQDRETFNGMFSAIVSVNRVFYQDRESPHGHCLMYDAHLMNMLLRHCGFDWVKKTEFRCGANPDLLIDSESRKCESLYVEAGVGSE